MIVDDGNLASTWLAPGPGPDECIPAECFLSDALAKEELFCSSCSLDMDEESTRVCLSCSGLSCPGCALHNLCPGCYFGHGSTAEIAEATRDEVDCDDFEEAPVLELKAGTEMLLRNGCKTATKMLTHGLRPQYVAEALRVDDLRSAQASLRRHLDPIEPKRVLLFEWCCSPNSKLGLVAGKAGVQVKRLSIERGFDMSKPAIVERVFAEATTHMQEGHPVRFHLALPCTDWCGLTNITCKVKPSYRTVRGIRRLKSRRMIKLFAQGARRLKARFPTLFGAGFEWPRNSEGWRVHKCPEIAQIIQLCPHRCDVDGCSVGVRDSKGAPLLKPWRLQTTQPAMARVFAGKRCKRLHSHGVCRGREAYMSGFYPMAFCSGLVKGYLSHPEVDWSPADTMVVSEVMPTEDGNGNETVVEATDEKGPATSRRVRGPMRAVLAAIRKLHIQLGHPENRRLARAIRVSGGSETAVSAALAYKCETCEKLKQPPPANPASIATVDLQAFDRVGVDLFMLADVYGHSVTFLNIVDWATTFQVVVPVPSKRPDIIFMALLTSWIIPLGCPREIVSDRGGEFEREFIEGLEWLNIRWLDAPPESPTQNSITERCGASWKMQARATLEETSLRLDANPMNSWWLCAAVCWSRNQQVNDTGFSPAQWVLGRSLRLPADLLDGMGRFDIAMRYQERPDFAERLRLISAAQRTLAAQRASRGLARAMSSRMRTPKTMTGYYIIGDQVMFWRRPKTKSAWAGCWHGPAVIIGVEAPNYWLAHRGTTLKAGPRQLRACTPAEMLDWYGVFDQAMRDDSVNKNGLPAEEEKREAPTTKDDSRDDMPGLGDSDGEDDGDPAPTAKRARKSYSDLTKLGEPPLANSGGPQQHPSQPRDPDSSSATPTAPAPSHKRWRSGSLTPAAPVRGGDDARRPAQPATTSGDDDVRNEARDDDFHGIDARGSDDIDVPVPDDGDDDLMTATQQDEQQPTRQEEQQQPSAQPRAPKAKRSKQAKQAAAQATWLRQLTQRQRQLAATTNRNVIRQRDEPPRASASSSASAVPPAAAIPTSTNPTRMTARQRSALDDLPRTRPPQALRPAATIPTSLNRATMTTRQRDAFDDLPRSIRTSTPAAVSFQAHDGLTSAGRYGDERLGGGESEPAAKRLRDRDVMAVIPDEYTLETFQDQYGVPYVVLVPFSETIGREINLTGAARSKELDIRNLSKEQWQLCLEGMKKEWSKWKEFKATRDGGPGEIATMLKTTRPVGTRWVVTQKPDGSIKCRLVVQGCQEAALDLRTDAPTGSNEALMLTAQMGLQPGWTQDIYDAQTAYLQSGQIDRNLVLRLPREHPENPGGLVIALGSIYGTRDAARAWYAHSRKILIEHGFVESRFEKGWYLRFGGPKSSLDMVLHSHVDDFYVARVHSSSTAACMAKLEKVLHLKRKSLPFTYCGLDFSQLPDGSLFLSQKSKAEELDTIELARGTDDSKELEPSQRSEYRTVIGQLLWLALKTRPDLGSATSILAQRTMKSKASDARELNRISRYARSTADEGIVLRKGVVDIFGATLLVFSDSAFANAEGERSQCGTVTVLVMPQHVNDVIEKGRYDLCTFLGGRSATVKRVVRSTLAAEGYATSEGVECGSYIYPGAHRGDERPSDEIGSTD